jgi:hypothetical protein
MAKIMPMLAAVAVLAALGIALLSLRQPEDRTASDLRERSIAAVGNVSSYSYFITLSARSTGFTAGGAVNVTTRMVGNGTIDVRGRFMHALVGILVSGDSGNDSINTLTRMEMYVVNNTLYSYTGGKWVKGEMKEDAWGNTQLDQQATASKDAPAHIAGMENVSGEPVYVLVLMPELGTAPAYMAGLETGTGGPQGELLQNRIVELISAERLLPVRIVNELAFAAGNITTNMTITSDYYDYDTPVESKIPEYAAGALPAGGG